MTIGEHLDELRLRLIRIVIAMLVITAFCLSFGLTTIHLSFDPSSGTITSSESPNNGSSQLASNSISITIYYPYYNPFGNIAIQLTKFMENTLLPTEVSLIQTAPGQAFFSQVYIAILLSILLSMPLIIREMYAFISPAFSKAKSVLSVKTFVPTILLFVVGVIFSYVIVIPVILNFLYTFGESIGVATFFSINEFFPFVLQLLVAFGLAFELPAIMYALSLTGVVDAALWKKNFRYAVIVFVIFGAIITPDGGGVSMWLVVAPMIVLYLAGLMVVKRSRNENNRLTNSGAEASAKF